MDVAPVISQVSCDDPPADMVGFEAVKEFITGGVPEAVVTVMEAVAVTDPLLLAAVIT